MGFVEKYLENTKDYESCSDFWRWSGYAAIAGVLRDNCYFMMKSTRVYPNIYVLFLADSSFDRKGVPVNSVTSMLRKVRNTKVIAGRGSMQGILHDLTQSETDEKSGKVIRAGSATLFAREMTANIIGNADAVKMLTDMYEPQEKYDLTLRSSEKAHVSNLVFSMLAASNRDLLTDMFDKTAIKGGLLARIFLVTPNEWRPRNSLLDNDDAAINDDKELVDELKKISKLNGRFIFTAQAIECFNTWYIPFGNLLQNRRDKIGLMGRIHTSALKLACILAANDLTITIEAKHITRAINESLALVKNYAQLTGPAGKSTTKDAASILLAALVKHGTVSKTMLLSENWEDLDMDMLDKATIILTEAKFITTHVWNNELTYQLTKAGINEMTMDHTKGSKNGNK